MNKSETIKELATALVKVQADVKNPTFDQTNIHWKNKYASLATVRNSLVPVFAQHGIAVIQSLRGGEGEVECETMLMHTSGEWLSDTLSLPVSKNDAQGYGSAITYARRYSLMSFAGVVGDEDDDGNAAVKAAPADGKSDRARLTEQTKTANNRAEEEMAESAKVVLSQDEIRQAQLIASVVLDAWDGGDQDLAYTNWAGAEFTGHDQKTYTWSLLKARSKAITTTLTRMNETKKLQSAGLRIAGQA